MRIPEFTRAQLVELATIGVTEIQVDELSAAVSFINLQLVKPAARNDLDSLLREVVSASEKLSRTLKSMTPPIDECHNEAFQILERGYWGEQPDAWECFFVDHVGPSIDALAQAAKKGLGSLPQQATRNKTANWYPIKVIEDALLLGWLKMHMTDEERDSVMCLAQLFVRVDGVEEFQLPDELRPSASPGCAFRRIVGICYAAAGGNPDPERALKAFMKYRRERATANP